MAPDHVDAFASKPCCRLYLGTTRFLRLCFKAGRVERQQRAWQPQCPKVATVQCSCSHVSAAQDAEVSVAKDTADTGDRAASQQPAGEQTPGLLKSRRAWLLTAAGTAGGALASSSGSGQADAFPSQGLETLQESAATSSTRAGQESGISALRNPAIYRGAATEKAVRKAYGLDGLLPAARSGLQKEVDRAVLWIERGCTPLDKYQALMTLKETNRDCFLGVLNQNLTKYLPIVYTPTVGKACEEWSHLLQRPTGLYVSINDLLSVRRLVNNWPEDEVKIAVITDGERILGLGDLGANGLGIPVGKAVVHSVAGIDPRFVIPVVLDVGCNTPSITGDRLYIGLRQERVRGAKYDALVDEVIRALRNRYGEALLIHWEDFAARNSFRLLAKYRQMGVSTFNDDIESTAAAVLAAVLGAVQLKGVPPLSKQVFLMLGAGQANIGSARLLTRALQAEGLTEPEARSRIWLFDSKGVVFAGRQEGTLSPEKAEFQRPASEGVSDTDFAQAVQLIGPTAIVGAAGKKGSIPQEAIVALLKGVEAGFGESARPIVLALSNPDSVAECTAEAAYEWSEGKVVYASGTAFPPFKRRDGRTYVPSQANNSLIFPGVGLGCIASGATSVTDSMMLAAARAVASKLTKQELSQGSVLPATDRLRDVSLTVAAAVALTAAQGMVASASGSDVLSCLPLGKGPNDAAALKLAEGCIAKSRYDPFASEAVSPSPISPILP